VNDSSPLPLTLAVVQMLGLLLWVIWDPPRDQPMDPLQRLIADMEAIYQDHMAGEPEQGCYGIGRDHLCPTCAAYQRYLKSAK